MMEILLFFRFHPAIQRFKTIIDSGELGAIKSIEAKMHAPKGVVTEGDIRYDFALGGGALMDCGCTSAPLAYHPALTTY